MLRSENTSHSSCAGARGLYRCLDHSRRSGTVLMFYWRYRLCTDVDVWKHSSNNLKIVVQYSSWVNVLSYIPSVCPQFSVNEVFMLFIISAPDSKFNTEPLSSVPTTDFYFESPRRRILSQKWFFSISNNMASRFCVCPLNSATPSEPLCSDHRVWLDFVLFTCVLDGSPLTHLPVDYRATHVSLAC